MNLPFGPPIDPMLAKLTEQIPGDGGWHYDPKWDGFRTLVFFDGSELYLQSRDRRPLARYFPELHTGLLQALPGPMALDGEAVIMGEHGLDFDALLLRIHPAESRIQKLAAQTPASFVAFDLLAEGSEDLRQTPFGERRRRLEAVLAGVAAPAYLTPGTEARDVALGWFEHFEGAGLDGIVARRLDEAYLPGQRAMLKIKHHRTADCAVGGFRWNRGEEGRSVGSLLLGLYDPQGVLHYVGHTSSFKGPEKRELAEQLRQFLTEDSSTGFGQGRTPGGPSRWRDEQLTQWVRLRPELVCEVAFEQLQGDRFRHAATFLRWRPDKPPRECTFDQIIPAVPAELRQVFAAGG